MYSKIDHDIRNRAQLSMLDYCLLDSIYQLSTSGKERYRTWCDMKKSKFSFLASERTIVNAFNRLEKNGWMEFKNEKRYLKRTTKKYYEEVRAYILGVQELHLNSKTGVQELHGKGARVAQQRCNSCTAKGVIVAPNNNKDNNKDTYKDKVKEEELPPKKYSNIDLKKTETPEDQKSCAKKGNQSHAFPDMAPKKSYDAFSHFDKRTNEQLSFSLESASKTIALMFPSIEDLSKAYNSLHSEKATDEVLKKAKGTFIETGITNYHSNIRTVTLLRDMFFKWIVTEVKWQRENVSKTKSQFTKSSSLMIGGESDLNHRNKWMKND